MRKVVLSEFISLDGVVEDPGGAEKFEHGGWTWNYFNEEMGKFKNDELAAADSFLLGRVTYQAFAAAWPERTDEYGYAERMNGYPKYVVSTTLEKADEWNNSHIIKSNIIGEVGKLKQEAGKDILIFGSAKLSQTLIQHNLVDEYRLMTFPILLGSGKRLFERVPKLPLKLVESRQFASGVDLLTYEPVQ